MTGFGKSTFVKTYLGRMLNQDKDMMVFLFDSIVRPEYALGPDGRYETSFAGITGCKVHRFGGDEGSGPGPVRRIPRRRGWRRTSWRAWRRSRTTRTCSPTST